MNITIEEIAQLAGVSKTTVSRVINKKPDVHPETREKILQLIEEYDFRPNVFAKAISIQKSQTIGLIIPHLVENIFTNQFFLEVLHGVSTAVDKRGYYLLLFYPNEQDYLDVYKQKRVDGFILMSPGAFQIDIIELLKKAQAPFVSTAKVHGEPDMTWVDVDNFYGGLLAGRHLIDLGHRRIAFIGKPSLKSSTDRLEGYRQVLLENGIEYDDRLVVVAEIATVNGGYQATCNLLDSVKDVTAIFLANDIMAIGAIRAAIERGRRVPQDLSIIGFDDIPFAQYLTPALTSVRQPAFEKGARAIDLLVDYLEEGTQPSSETLEIELVIRKSTGPAPHTRAS
jgi:DNA-binding LacI/PurR family transcriptional regulator